MNEIFFTDFFLFPFNLYILSIFKELVTPVPTDDSENTSSTVFNSPLKPGNFVHSTQRPYFQSCDFEPFHGFKSRGDSIVAQPNKTIGSSSSGNNEKALEDSEYAATV